MRPRIPLEDQIVEGSGTAEPDFRPIYIPDRLAQMMRRQLELQRAGRSLDPPTMKGEERGWYVTWNHTSLIKELGEALDEVAWKPWSMDKDTFNRKQFVKELVDAWHFLMNMLLVASGVGYTDETAMEELAAEFFELYMEKSEVNMQRFKSGTYDSKATKCPDCGRDKEAWAVLNDGIPMPGTSPPEYPFMCLCGRLNYLALDHDPRDPAPR